MTIATQIRNDRARPNGVKKPHHRKPPIIDRSEATESGKVKWFDIDRAFGFIISDAGPEVFIHVGVLRRYGIDENRVANAPGMRLRFKTQPGVINATPVVVAVFEE